MYLASTQRLTLAGARKIVATATAQAEAARIAISVVVAGGSFEFDERVARAAVESKGASWQARPR